MSLPIDIMRMINSSASSLGSGNFTIPASTVGSDLTDFPVYVRLSDAPASFWASVSGGGANILVKDGLGNNIPFHLLLIDTGAETGHLFFKAPMIYAAVDTPFNIVLTGVSLPAVGDPNGQYAVWTDYEVVYHLVGNWDDAKGDHPLTTQSGTAPSFVDWECGGGIEATAVGSKYVPNVLPGGTTFTLGATVTQTDFSGSINRQAISICSTFGSSANRCCLGQRNSGSDPLSMFDDPNSFLVSPNTHSSGERKRINGVWTGGVGRELFIDGVSVASDGGSSTGLSSDTFVIGGSGGGAGSGSSWLGRVGYVYLRYEALSDDWIEAEALNLSAPSTFYDWV